MPPAITSILKQVTPLGVVGPSARRVVAFDFDIEIGAAGAVTSHDAPSSVTVELAGPGSYTITFPAVKKLKARAAHISPVPIVALESRVAEIRCDASTGICTLSTLDSDGSGTGTAPVSGARLNVAGTIDYS